MEESNIPQKRKAPDDLRENNSKRPCNDQVLINLMTQVNNIQSFLANFISPEQVPQPVVENDSGQDEDILDANISGDLFDPDQDNVLTDNADQSIGLPPAISAEIQVPCTDSTSVTLFSLPVNTVIKEPTVPRSSPDHLDKLKELQHFDSDSWSEVRYAEVQKKYCTTPGFVELECNEEFKPYESSLNLNHTERGFASISLALLKQNEALENAIRSFVSWLGSVESTDTKSVENKICELFLQSDYQKISNDLLQMACGHRADMIQQRRDNLLRSVKNKFIRASIRKIPPSVGHLYQSDELSAVIEKNGGSSKIFWPSKEARTKKSVTFENIKQNPSPAQGLGTNYQFSPAHGGHFGLQGTLPPQGSFNTYLTPTQGTFPHYPGMVMTPTLAFPRTPTQGRIFRPRGPRPSQENRSAAKHFTSDSARKDGRSRKKF